VRARRLSFVESIATSSWVGLSNFQFIASPRAQMVLRNTFLYNFSWMVLSLIISVSLAIALSHLRNKRGVKLYQTGIFMPYFISWVIASYLLFALLSHERGLIRSITVGLGAFTSEDYPNYYLNPRVWPMILTLANQWKYMGYDSIVYTAAISGIAIEMYEAAVLDGAGTWGRIRYVTLPMLRPMMIILTIMAMGRMASADFGLFYNLPMNSGQITSTTDVFDTYVFRMLTGNSTSIGVTAAASFFQSMVGFVLIMASNMLVKKLSPDETLF
jgi:putative aldouronate transport system permease protein